MEKPLLKDPNQVPTPEILRKTIGEDSFAAYKCLEQEALPLGLEFIWNFYKDGNVWLCKVVFKKKTVFWLSVWDGYFQTGFYFTEKTRDGIFTLDIPESIKQDFSGQKPAGKLILLPVQVRQVQQVEGLLKIINYKKSLK